MTKTTKTDVETTATATVTTETVDLTEVPSIKRYSKGTENVMNSKLEEIKSRVQGINTRTSSISSTILEKSKTKDVDTADKLLTEAVVSMEKFMPKSGASGWFKAFVSKLPFAEKIMTNIEKTVVDNLSAQESMEKLFKSFDKAIDLMNEDVNEMHSLMVALDESKLENEQISVEIEKELQSLIAENKKENGMVIFSLKQMKTELASISMVNKQTADTIDAELACAEAMTTKLTEIKPYLSSILSAQLALAAQNSKNKRVQETTNVLTTLVNDIVLEQNKSSQESIRETLKLTQAPVIKQATLVNLEKQMVEDANAMKKLVVDLQKSNQEYLKIQEKTLKQIESHSSSYNQIAYDLNTSEKKVVENKQ